MKTITFKGYGPGSPEIVVVVAHIMLCYPIDYNGNHGTRLTLTNGKEVNVGNWLTEVQDAVNAALT